ncbi:MAG: hypothetical protein KAH22_02540 [Thiotrichaceae bacterium]|nr:hypothetical protein [Thiotrichaceae bacterium]
MNKETHYIFIPSLLSPLKIWQRDYHFTATTLLVKHLNRAKRTDYPALHWLQHACILLAEKHHSFSYAEQLYHAHFNQTTEQAILCASPISMTAGMSDIVIGDFVIEDISSEQQQALCKELNRHFSQDGWEFKVSTMGTWFLLLNQKDKPKKTIPINNALGASLRDLMEGKIEIAWGKQLNELQMLLYNSPTNQQRELARQEQVQSFWLWDRKDKSLSQPLKINAQCIQGGGEQGQRLAQHFSLDYYEHHNGIPHTSSIIIHDELINASQLNDMTAWQQGLSQIEDKIIPLIENKEIHTIIYTDSGHSWDLGKTPFWSRFKLKSAKQLIELI